MLVCGAKLGDLGALKLKKGVMLKLESPTCCQQWRSSVRLFVLCFKLNFS